MNLEAQIKSDIESHELMACYDLHRSLSAIDFKALADSDNANDAGYSVDGDVATINVRGLLVPKMSRDYSDYGVTGYNHVIEYLERANNDPSVSSIVLDVDSGGGYVAGLDEVTETIYQSPKPVEAHASGSMYSAAYWLAASANSVTATKASGIGSIGVLVAHYEHSKALEQEGITPTFIRSGKWKAWGGSTEPLTDEQKARLQESVNEQASIFFNHVAANRKRVSVSDLIGWQGDKFTAEQAKQKGLIDRIVKRVQATTYPPNPTLSAEETMDLQQAQAKIAELEDLRAKERAEHEAQLQAKEAQLAEFKAAKRDEAITALAAKTGREFSDDEVAKFKAMSDDSFEFAASLLDSVAKKPELPAQLFTEQAVNGATQATDDLDAKIKQWAGA